MDSTNFDPIKQVNQPEQVHVHSESSVIHGSDVDHRVGCIVESTLAQRQASSESRLRDDELSQRCIFNMMEKEIALARTFLERNKNVDKPDENGERGLMRALHTRNAEALRIYCQANAYVNRRDDTGFTPLMLAARQGYTQGIEILLEHGADVDIIDDHGMMAIDYLKMSRAFIFQSDSCSLPKATLKEILIRKACNIRNITPQQYKKVRKELREWKFAQSQQNLDGVDFGSRVENLSRIGLRDVYKWAYGHILANQQMNPQSERDINLDLTIQDIKRLIDFCDLHSFNYPNCDNRPLLCAMQRNLPDMVNILIKAGADKEAHVLKGVRPLMLAARDGRVDVLKVLLNAGVNRNAQDQEGRSALMLATMHHQHETMRLLLADRATDKELRDDYYRTALRVAFEPQNFDNIELNDQTVNLLLDYGVNAEQRDNAIGRTTLMLAIQLRLPIATERLLRFYCDKGQLDALNYQAETAFIWAVRCNNLYAARCLLESGANIEARNHDGDTGLIQAAKRNCVELINLMLFPPRSVPSKADIEVRNNLNQTALIVAAKYRNQEALERLLNAGANTEAVASDDMTALRYAIYHGNISMIRCLIQHGVNVNQINPITGHTPILEAQCFERFFVNSYPTGIPQLLMDAGAANPETSEIVRKWVRGQWEVNQETNPIWSLDPELTFDEVLEFARQSIK